MWVEKLEAEDQRAQESAAAAEKRLNELQPKLHQARDIQAQMKPVRKRLETAGTARNAAAERLAEA